MSYGRSPLISRLEVEPLPLNDVRSSSSIARLRQGAFIGWVRRGSLLISDMVLIALSWLFARQFSSESSSFLSIEKYEATIVLVLAICFGVFAARNLYKAGKPRRDYLGVIKALTLSSFLLILISYIYDPSHAIAISQFLTFWLASTSGVCLGRLVIDQVTSSLRQGGAIRYPAMIIADPEVQPQVTRVVDEEQRYNIVSVLPSSALDLKNRDRTFQELQELNIAEVFVAWDAMRSRMFLGQWFQARGITVHVMPIEREQLLGGAYLHMLNERIPCVTFDSPVLAGSDFWLKRLFDIVVSATFLVLASPIYLAVAIAIRLESAGPIFYRQTRIGLHGRPFKVWKFRSMVQDADKLQADLEQMNQNKDGVLFKIKGDPRITRVGHFIRRYSIDELPQFFNVLVGEMSLVGPRPLPVRDVEKFKERYFIRQDVLPGITGMWQVSGRSDIDNFDDVLKLDLYYIQNWSIWLDISILFRTFAAVLQKSGAY